MSPDAILASITSAIDFETTFATISAGLLMGAFVLWQLPTYRVAEFRYPWGLFILFVLGAMFFASRGFALFFEGSTLWPRNIGFTGLWFIFCASMLTGVSLRRRRAVWLRS